MSSSDDAIWKRIRELYQDFQPHRQTATEAQEKFLRDLGLEPTAGLDKREAAVMIQKALRARPLSQKQREFLDSLPESLTKGFFKDQSDITQNDFSRFLSVLNYRKFESRIFQHSLESHDAYEYGWQENTAFPEGRMYYLVFYDFMMIDIDGATIENLAIFDWYLSLLRLSGRLYQTRNGFHLFITSEPIYHKSDHANKIMKIFGCDAFYSAFSYHYGYRVRLSLKPGADEEVAAKFHSRIGTTPEDPQLVALLAVHDSYILRHRRL